MSRPRTEDVAEGAGFQVVRLTSEFVPGAVQVLRQSFFPDEKICCCVRILQDSEELSLDPKYKVTKASKELEDLAVDTVKDGVSFCAIDTATKEVLGVAFNKIQVKTQPDELSYFEQFAKDNIKEFSALELVDFMVKVDSKYDLFEEGADCYFEIMFLAVKSTTKGKGIGTSLIKKSFDLAQDMKWKNEGEKPELDVTTDAKEFGDSKALKMAPKFVSAIFTSRFSQKCGLNSGFTHVMRVPYTEFTYKGKSYLETTGTDHPECTLSIKNCA